jgi:predicted metal-dependent hydrolase
LKQNKLEFLFKTSYFFLTETISIPGIQYLFGNKRHAGGAALEKKNLNFNSRIALLPEKLAEYIVAHELCHLGEFNHSKRFWDLVEKILPDYKQRRE